MCDSNRCNAGRNPANKFLSAKKSSVRLYLNDLCSVHTNTYLSIASHIVSTLFPSAAAIRAQLLLLSIHRNCIVSFIPSFFSGAKRYCITCRWCTTVRRTKIRRREKKTRAKSIQPPLNALVQVIRLLPAQPYATHSSGFRLVSSKGKLFAGTLQSVRQVDVCT